MSEGPPRTMKMDLVVCGYAMPYAAFWVMNRGF
jgi:hypothetical protein